jgi:hypothetical protein
MKEFSEISCLRYKDTLFIQGLIFIEIFMRLAGFEVLRPVTMKIMRWISLGYKAMQFKDIPTFRRNISPPSSVSKSKLASVSVYFLLSLPSTLKIGAIYSSETSGCLRNKRRFNSKCHNLYQIFSSCKIFTKTRNVYITFGFNEIIWYVIQLYVPNIYVH